jgi:hypothetical protein
MVALQAKVRSINPAVQTPDVGGGDEIGVVGYCDKVTCSTSDPTRCIGPGIRRENFDVIISGGCIWQNQNAVCTPY